MEINRIRYLSIVKPTLPYPIRRGVAYVQRYLNAGTSESRRGVILWHLFTVVNHRLREAGVPNWVNFGTLLGIHREGRLLPHDIDIDFGCEERHYPAVIAALSDLPSDMRLIDTSDRHHGPKLYVDHKGFDADVYFYRPVECALQPLEKTRWPNYTRSIPLDLVLPTRERDVNGLRVSVPADVEGYLKHIYGSLAPDAVRNPQTGFWE